MRVLKRKTLETPNNHNHKYNTRSKRNCYLRSSTQGCVAAKEPDLQNQDPLTCVSTQNHACPIPLVGRRQGARYKTLVACAHSSAFPDDLIFTILLLIPAKLLHENMRFVSRAWRKAITSPSFITNHLKISSAHHTHGLLVDRPQQQNNVAFYMPPTSDANPEFQVTELAKPPFPSRIRGSYHGLVLLQHELNRDQFHVVNLVTKSIVSLPCFPLLADLTPETALVLTWTGIALSYASSINRYKVVIGIHPHINRLFQYPTPPQVWVYTVGVDQNWRKLKLLGTDKIYGTSRRILFDTPRSVGGFVYWSSRSFPYGCALDVDTETFYRFTTFPRPNTIPKTNDGKYWIICLQTGLGLVISYKFGVLWKLYKLTDLKSSKWTKIIDIDVRVIRSQIGKYYRPTDFPTLRPFVYTNDEKLWFLGCHSTVDMFYYNLREKNVVPFPVKGKFISVYHHVNTLLTLKNC